MGYEKLEGDIPVNMTYRPEVTEDIARLVESAKKIAIISHRNPDGDTSGAGLALRIIFEEQGKYVDNICGDELPLAYRYMPGAHRFLQDFAINDYDLIIAVDAATRGQTGFQDKKPEIFEGKVPLINIDHHISNEHFGAVNQVEAAACSTTAVIWKVAQQLEWHVSSNAATCLMNGLMTDTGSLQHSNSTPEALRIAAKMLAAGANLQQIRSNVYRSTPIPTMRLWGKILERMELDGSGGIVSIVKEEDFAKTGADPKDVAGAIDYLNMVQRAKFSLLLTERGGNVKGSFRTQRDDVNVSDMAGRFGGGGHIKAAGFTTPGRIRVEKRFTIIPS